MQVNCDKFRLLPYVIGNENRVSRTYTPDREKIKAATEIKDLGIYMCSNGKFGFHIEKVTKKVQQMMKWVLRTFTMQAPKPIITLFKAVVLPAPQIQLSGVEPGYAGVD